jgi:predicted nucleic acid-binding protein
MPQRYFLDTSALLARFLARAAGHNWVRGLCDPAARNTIAIVEITGAELAASLHQMVRGGNLRQRTCDRAYTAYWLQVDASEYQIVAVTSILVRRAADLCRSHSLRGYDSVQLAAGLTFRDDARLADSQSADLGNPILGDPIFLTEDRRLAEAALAQGFTIDSPVNHP